MSAPAKLEVSTPTDREVVMTRTFNAPRERVFKALTTPALIQRWLLGPEGWTMPVCEVDLRVDGALRYEWRGPDGSGMGMSGVFREVEPPARLVHTELFDEDWTGGETRVTTILTEQDGRTTVTTTILYPSQENRDNALKFGMEGGVAASYHRLDRVLD